MTVEEQIFLHASSTPDKIALTAGGSSLTYSQLWHDICRAAAYLRSQGLPNDSRIVLSADKNIDFIVWYFGAHLAGLICVPIDPETNPSRLRRIFDCSKPALIMGSLRHTAADREVIPFPALDSLTSEPLPTTFPAEDAVADLMFTTGTTGLPKGVALSFANQGAAAKNINTFIGNTPEDRELIALPISHSFGLGRIRCVLSRGGTLVLLGSFASMKKFYAAIEQEGVTGFGMVPASWAYISRMSGDRIGRYADQLRYIEIGSAFMSLEEKQRLCSLLPNTRICMHYGLTEASRSAFLCFGDSPQHLASAGKASPGVEIKIFDAEGNVLPPDSDGEVAVRGQHVCSSYWGMTQEEFRRDFFGDFFRTGDLGHLDTDGYLHLIGREKEIINVGGKKVSPLEVEEAINSMEGVAESACIGVPDPVMGEVVVAYIVEKRPLADEEVKKHLLPRLENYKIPVAFHRVESLPKTSSGKLQRLALKSQI